MEKNSLVSAQAKEEEEKRREEEEEEEEESCAVECEREWYLKLAQAVYVSK
jgi:hypothetical protein